MQATVVTDRLCFCNCHRHGVGYYAAYRDDITEAALACSVCINAHCPAILSRDNWPYHKPDPLIPHNDATAYTEEGEGPESV